jgi:hypothetical protein
MGCRTCTKRSITSKQAREPKLNAANAVVVDSLADHADAVVHLGELVEAARLSVRAAIRTGEDLDVERGRHRTGLHEHRGRT